MWTSPARATRRHGVTAHLDLCTGGQVTAKRAEWIAAHFDSVQVSIDGPADVHNRQRPRADGRDSLAGPLRLARAVKAAGKRLCVKAIVTAATVGRMAEIVDFVAREIGRARLDLGMMFAPPWVRPDAAAPPEWREFVAGFGKALDRGAELGVRVQHPSISWETLAAVQGPRAARHFCLAPPNVVTSFFDVPEEGSAAPQLGAYGWYDGSRNTSTSITRNACAWRGSRPLGPVSGAPAALPVWAREGSRAACRRRTRSSGRSARHGSACSRRCSGGLSHDTRPRHQRVERKLLA